jgi:hypothetical protein
MITVGKISTKKAEEAASFNTMEENLSLHLKKLILCLTFGSTYSALTML